MESITIDATNASDELRKAKGLLKAFNKGNAATKRRLGGSAHKARLQERISACQQVIERAESGGQSGTCDPVSSAAHQPNTLANSGNGTGNHQAARQAHTEGPVIDPSLLSDGPAAKAMKLNNGQRHRKIIEEDPLTLIVESIPGKMTSGFLRHWLQDGAALERTESTRSVEAYPDLRDVSIEIIDHIEDVAEEHQFTHEQFGWEIKSAGGPLKISDVILLRAWLLANELIFEGVEFKGSATAQKAPSGNRIIRIRHEGKLISMTPKMLTDARLEPSKYPGCVEAGMGVVTEILKNRNGRSKCITCHTSGPRGRELDSRPIPPVADHPFLNECKCPLNGAALELWMIKQTAGMQGIPQRGNDEVAARRLALNPDVLKLIGGAIEVASGLDVDGLLQPKADRLEATARWALEGLHSIAVAENSAFADSFTLLSQKLCDTMHHWMNEDSDGDE